ncbi:cytochrome c family protein [Pleomorphomonas sp. JP5]|uniref:c-type cytochrome n=1 Tax=Pleomorphomonas sp. JP5 TaxID=2942998 RepID=UPI002043A320|nr:cytochrome c family protein [Pleomorphomonas sp. JP5]MCM5558144.1 cytochrome c family protein [Pleomorphomonas sp. JP5]
MSLQPNKILGAVLAVAVVVFAVDFVSNQIFAKQDLKTPGYVIDMNAAPAVVATEAPAAGSNASAATQQAAAPAASPASDVAPIAERLKTADVAAGEKTSKVCAACHSFADSGANKVGPGLWEVVNRKPGTHEGFKYSPAMATFGETHTWDYATLDIYLTNPKAEVPGNKMAFAGIKKPQDRANLIAYLRSLSTNPAPLP